MRGLHKKSAQEKNLNGFILIELMIVLLIIIILLAILIPIVISNIDKAKENAELSEARAVKVAVQTTVINDFTEDNLDKIFESVDYDNKGLSDYGKKEVERLLGMDIGRVEKIIINSRGYLTEFTYFTFNGSKIIYENGKYNTVYIY